MPLPFVGYNRTVGNADKIPSEPNQCSAISPENRRAYRSRIHSRWDELSSAGDLRPPKHALNNHVKHIEPVVKKKTHAPHTGGEKDKDRLEIRGTHQRLLPSVACASKVCNLGHGNEDIQDGIHKIVYSAGKIDVHEGKGHCVQDRACITADLLRKHQEIRHCLSRVGHGGHQIQRAVGHCEASITSGLWTSGQDRLEKIEEGEYEVLDEVEERCPERTECGELVDNCWDGIAIQDTKSKENYAIPNGNNTPKGYVKHIKNLYNCILNKWSQKGVIAPKHVSPNPREFFINQVKNGAQSHQSSGPKQPPRKRRQDVHCCEKNTGDRVGHEIKERNHKLCRGDLLHPFRPRTKQIRESTHETPHDTEDNQSHCKRQ